MALGGIVTWSLWRAGSGSSGSGRADAEAPDDESAGDPGDAANKSHRRHGDGHPRPDTRSGPPEATRPAIFFLAVPGVAASATGLGKVFFLHLGIGAVLFGGGYTLVGKHYYGCANSSNNNAAAATGQR